MLQRQEIMLIGTAGQLWYEELDLEDLEMLAIYSGDPKMVPRDHWFNGVMPFSMRIGGFAMVLIGCYTGLTHSFRGNLQN